MGFSVILRIEIIFIIFCIMALWEFLSPRRQLHINKKKRWVINFSLAIIEQIILKVILPFTAVSMALYTQDKQMGLFNYLHIPLGYSFLLTILLLDFVMYIQHIGLHKIPPLWRLHKIHHIDQDVDVTTSFRQHPIQAIFTVLIIFLTILIFGPPFVAVATYEIILLTVLMFNHGNINKFGNFEKVIRSFVVTPDMHRVHHSAFQVETDSNYGFVFPWWDHIFRTYTKKPKDGHIKMITGLYEYQDYQKTGFLALLQIPFRKN